MEDAKDEGEEWYEKLEVEQKINGGNHVDCDCVHEFAVCDIKSHFKRLYPEIGAKSYGQCAYCADQSD